MEKQTDKQPKECIHCARIPNYLLEAPATEDDLKKAIAEYLGEPGRIRETNIQDLLFETVWMALGNNDDTYQPADRSKIVREVADLVKLINFFDRHFYNIHPDYIYNH